MKKITGHGFDREAYRRRLRLLRQIYSGENQIEFAKRLDIPFKRWSNYERGYPVPRETAWILMEKCDGVSVEWLWFGITGNLSSEFKQKLRSAEAREIALSEAEAELERAKKKYRQVSGKQRGASSQVRR